MAVTHANTTCVCMYVCIRSSTHTLWIEFECTYNIHKDTQTKKEREKREGGQEKEGDGLTEGGVLDILAVIHK